MEMSLARGRAFLLETIELKRGGHGAHGLREIFFSIFPVFCQGVVRVLNSNLKSF